MSAAVNEAREPPNLPIGVRTPESMKTSSTLTSRDISGQFSLGRRGRFNSSRKLRDVDVIYGINAVSEALKSRGRAFEYIGVSPERHDLRGRKI